MKKSYCTQSPRKGTKESRAMAAYDGFKGGATVEHVRKLVGKELAERLTGHEFGLVMSAVNRAYHEGRASTGAEMIDANCVWINGIDRGIEWIEVGAEYETQEFEENVCGRISKGVRSVKIKDGEMVARFVD